MPLTVIPETPKEWLCHSPIQTEEGMRSNCWIIRPWNEVTPYVTCRAYVSEDGIWEYECGSYCKDLKQAMEIWVERT